MREEGREGGREGKIREWMTIDQRNLHWFGCDSLLTIVNEIRPCQLLTDKTKLNLHLRASKVYGVLPGLVVVEEILETEEFSLQYGGVAPVDLSVIS